MARCWSVADVHVQLRINLRAAVLDKAISLTAPHGNNRGKARAAWALPPLACTYSGISTAAPYLRQPLCTPALKSLLRTSVIGPNQPNSPPRELDILENPERTKINASYSLALSWTGGHSLFSLPVKESLDPIFRPLPMLARRALQLRWQSLRGQISLPNHSGARWTTPRLCSYSSAASDAARTQGSGRPVDGVTTGADSAVSLPIPIAAKMGPRAPPPPSGQNSSASSQASQPFQRTAQIARHLNSNSDSSSAQAATMSGYTVRKVAAQNTLEHRVYIEKDGVPVSPFHDVPLYANKEQTILNMVVEIPRWTNGKLEVSSQLQQLIGSG